MADVGFVYTNYFKVIDEEKLRRIADRIVTGQEISINKAETKNGNLYKIYCPSPFQCYCSEDGAEEEDGWIEPLMEVVEEKEAVLLFQCSCDKRASNAVNVCTVITRYTVRTFDFITSAIEAAATIMGVESYNTGFVEDEINR